MFTYEHKLESRNEMSLSPDEDAVVMLIKQIVDSLVDSSDQIKFEIIISESMVLIEVEAGSETGKILGRQGRLINSIRTILEAISAKEKRRYELEIL